ncbi:MAG: DUF2490 domain-containing protein [Bacteroidia bacterium]
MKAITFYIVAVLLNLIFINSALTQSRIQNINNNGWYMYFGNHRLTNKWSLHTEYQWRRNEWINNWQQSLARIGIDYRINDQAIITLGYGNIITYPYGEQAVLTTFNEHRIWQTLTLSHKNGRINFSHRYRLEQRFLDKYKKETNGEIIFDTLIYTNRIRYLFSVVIPINKAVIEKNTVFIRMYEEPFISFGKNVGKNIFDQNRLFFALGYQILPSTNIQLGYMNHLVFKNDGIHYENNNTLQIALTHNFDFRKKES